MFSTASIKELLSRFFHLDSLTESLSGYVEARVELLKLEVREEVAKAMTRVMVLVVIGLLGILFIIFVSMGLALLINEYFEFKYTGFFFVGGFYLILFLIAFAMRQQLIQAMERLLNKQFKTHKE